MKVYVVLECFSDYSDVRGVYSDVYVAHEEIKQMIANNKNESEFVMQGSILDKIRFPKEEVI